MKVVLASNNKGKIVEFREILKKYGIEVVSLKDINFTDEIVEDGNSYFENALIKAKTIYNVIKMPVIADDSGLNVIALNEAPGIYSARYGNMPTDQERNLLVLKQLEGVLDRRAYFHCSLVYYQSEDNYQHFTGQIHGNIGYMEKGDNGFGYDSIFIPNGYEITTAEMDSESKNKISHRMEAVKAFVKYLENDFSN